MRNVTIFTDGSCLGNPGRGGWGCILRCEGHEKELSGGYAHTTNNRMEIMAAIAGLEELKEPCAVTLYTDSQYLRHAVEKNGSRAGGKTAGRPPPRNRSRTAISGSACKSSSTATASRWNGCAGTTAMPRTNAAMSLPAGQSARHDLPEDTGYEPE